MEALHTEGLEGFKLEIFPDDNPDTGNPREWMQLGKLGVSGDLSGFDEVGHPNYSPAELLEDALVCPRCEGDGELEDGELCPRCEGDGEIDADLETYYAENYGAVGPVLPVSFTDYGSSGARCSIEHIEDANAVIFATAESIKETGATSTLEKIERQLRGEVEALDAYLQGNVLGYELEDPDGNPTGGCWGFLELEPYPLEETYCYQQGREELERCAQIARARRTAGAAAGRREQIERRKWEERDVMTMS